MVSMSLLNIHVLAALRRTMASSSLLAHADLIAFPVCPHQRSMKYSIQISVLSMLVIEQEFDSSGGSHSQRYRLFQMMLVFPHILLQVQKAKRQGRYWTIVLYHQCR